MQSRNPVRSMMLMLMLLLAAALLAPTAKAQGLGAIAASNMQFDAQMNAWLQNAQRQNAASQQQIWQHHLQTNGPRLQKAYREYMAAGNRPITFEQYAYWDLMTAAGTNIAGAQQAQQNQFAGNQAAYRTLKEGHQIQNNAWAVNSARQSAAIANHTNQAIRGVSPYVDPYTGAREMLPYSLPAGQVYRTNDQSYVRDQMGTYYRWAGNGWQRLEAAQK